MACRAGGQSTGCVAVQEQRLRVRPPAAAIATMPGPGGEEGHDVAQVVHVDAAGHDGHHVMRAPPAAEVGQLLEQIARMLAGKPGKLALGPAGVSGALPQGAVALDAAFGVRLGLPLHRITRACGRLRESCR
jgi:hypothetical protein